MRPIFSSRFSYKARAKTKSRNSANKHVGLVSAAILFGSLLAFYCVLFPELSGLWGRTTLQFLSWMMGGGRYFFPRFTRTISLIAIVRTEQS